MRRIGVYGGTFDPPHVAHLVVAERAFTALRLDELIIVPCGTPPLKAGTSAPAEARLELTRLAFGDRPEFTVSTVEVDRPGVSYTVETLQALVTEQPDAAWWWIVGGDRIADFPRWRSPERILELARLGVADRPGSDLATVLPTLPPAVRARLDWVPVPRLDVASSAIREDVAAGRSVRYLVPDPVRARIAKLQLYRNA